jgi:HTH-type transcriptional regulator/antitoxin HigA
MALATIDEAAYGKLLARALRVLMEDRGIRQRDLIPVFGSSSVVSDVLNGKRSISKAHARKLAEHFHVPASLFI